LLSISGDAATEPTLAAHIVEAARLIALRILQ
jgi:hypothetical protein